HVLRCLARCEGLAFGIELLDQGRHAAVELRREGRGDAALELRGIVRELLLVGREKLGPFLLGLLPGVAGVPAGANGFGDLERRVRPADGGAGGGDLFGTQGGAVRRAGVGLLRGTLGDHRLAADQAGAALLALRLTDGAVDGLYVVAVDVRDDLPAV